MTVFSAMCVAITFTAPVPKVKPPILRVQAFEPSIVLGDPVDLQVDFFNTRTESIMTKDDITHGSQRSLSFELRPDGDEPFRRIRLFEYETSSMPSLTYRKKYLPGESCTQHIFINRGVGKPHLSSAGKWHLRAVIEASDGMIYSEPITITVGEASETRLQSIEQNKHHIMTTLMFRGHAPVRDLSPLRDARVSFDKSYTGEVIENSLLVADYLAATTEAAKNAAHDAINRRLKKLPRVQSELMAIDYARALVKRKEYEAASKVVEGIGTKFHEMKDVEESIRTHAEKSK